MLISNNGFQLSAYFEYGIVKIYNFCSNMKYVPHSACTVLLNWIYGFVAENGISVIFCTKLNRAIKIEAMTSIH